MIKIKRDKIVIEVFECNKKKKDVWKIFEKHHYLTAKLHAGARCFIACWNGVPVGFNSVLSQPNGYFKNGWRGHRLVVLPDYQGLGIGKKLCEFIGELLLKEGKRYFTKTANIKIGEHRNNTSLWRATSHNMERRLDHVKSKRRIYKAIVNRELSYRMCYCHEYIGGE